MEGMVGGLDGVNRTPGGGPTTGIEPGNEPGNVPDSPPGNAPGSDPGPARLPPAPTPTAIALRGGGMGDAPNPALSEPFVERPCASPFIAAQYCLIKLCSSSEPL